MARIAFIDLGSKLVQYFSEVGKLLEPELQSFFYCTKPKAWSLADRLGCSVYPKNNISFSQLTVSDEIKTKILNKKILAEIPDDNELSSELDHIFSSLKSFIEQEEIDAVFLWNGSSLVASIAVFLAHEIGMKTIFGENGYFYNTMQLDPEGVNQASSITAKIENEYREVELEDAGLQELNIIIDAYRNNTPIRYTPNKSKVKAALFARISDEFSKLLKKDIKWSSTFNRNIPSDPGALPEKYIFIPFQVVKDSQLLLYSPVVGNDMVLFISSCHAAVKRVAQDYKVVVKLHPADVSNVDYSDLVAQYPDIIFLKDYPSNKLIQSASLVITINSTVGVEALIHNKPVITLGENFYNIPDVVCHVNALSDLPQAIKSALSTPPNKEKYQQFLYYLYHCYFTHGSWKNYSEKSIQAVALKISRLVNIT